VYLTVHERGEMVRTRLCAEHGLYHAPKCPECVKERVRTDEIVRLIQQAQECAAERRRMAR
jgi:hypothetical protein